MTDATTNQEINELLCQLEALSLEDIEEQTGLSCELMKDELRKELRSYELQLHLMPPLFPMGPPSYEEYFTQCTVIRNVAEARLYLERLPSIATFFCDISERLTIGMQVGMHYPKLVIQRYRLCGEQRL